MNAAGRVINGRYRLIDEIGRGGMAEIWEAEDSILDRRVALKLLHSQFARDPEFLERFRREARAAASLAHPNVVSVFDVGEDGATGTPFIVMELVDGESLKEWTRRGGALPEPRVREIGATLASVLEYAHGRGVIHRDVKPQNVLIGRDGRPRLTDFGIAQALNASSLTRTGAVMGSVHYMAPELARGQAIAPAADVYSLGAVLYEMATGRVPFTAQTDMAVALAHVEQPPTAPRALNPSLSPQLEAIILRALAKRPVERFASAGDLAGALRGTAVGDGTRLMPVAVSPEGPGPRASAAQATAAYRPPPRQALPRHAAAGRTGAGGGVLALLLVGAAALVAIGIGFFGIASFNRDGQISAAGRSTPTAPVAVSATALPSRTVLAAAPTATRVPTTEPTATQVPPTPTSPAPTATPAPPTATPRPTPPPATPTPQTVAVPNVVRQTQAAATAALRNLGLTVAPQRANVNAPEGTVVEQAPAAGAQARRGSTVTLSVATGQVEIPNVAGKPADAAAGQLNQLGFRVPTVRRVRNGQVPAGAAIRTDPPAGNVVERGSDVDLYVSNGASD